MLQVSCAMRMYYDRVMTGHQISAFDFYLPRRYCAIFTAKGCIDGCGNVIIVVSGSLHPPSPSKEGLTSSPTYEAA